MSTGKSLTDGKITIRAFELQDVPLMYAAARESIETVGPWLPWLHPDYSIREAGEWAARCQKTWAEETAYPFGIFESATGEVWGGLGIDHVNRVYNLAAVGYWVRASRTGHGIAPSAVRLAAKFAFSELGLTRVEIVVRLDNPASRRMAEKVGATFECIARNRIFSRGLPFDAAVYSLVPGDVAV